MFIVLMFFFMVGFFELLEFDLGIIDLMCDFCEFFCSVVSEVNV